MKMLPYLLEKEFRQIFRNKIILRLITVIPLVQLLILPLAANFEIRNINLYVVNSQPGLNAQRLTEKIRATGYFSIVGFSANEKEGMVALETDKADLILSFPHNFEKEFLLNKSPSLALHVNAVNGIKALVGSGYLNQIITDFIKDRYPLAPKPAINIETNHRYNPSLSYKDFMVPGILVILVTMLASFMCSLNIVKEKEAGTIEQINVSPIPRYVFILGKLIPFLLIGLFVFTLGLFLITMGIYHIFPKGSLLLIYTYLFIFLIALLGFGLLISTYTQNQQQAMSLAYFAIMIFILMSGLFTPVDPMPEWAKWMARLNPVTYFIEVLRMVMLKGSNWSQVGNHFLIMAAFAVFFNVWAVLNYSKKGA